MIFVHAVEAVLIADVQGVFTGLVGKLRDAFPVGRPRRIAVGNAR